jgi:peptidoglycan/LPS O-acetylase OafA/YrhL
VRNLTEPRATIAQLDGLRAIAVLLVLVQHFGPRSWWIDAIGPGGLGVALFFVLSGYLLTGILLEQRAARGAALWPVLRVFYARRFVRILPLYYLVLAVTAALDVGPARRALGYNLAYLSNLYFARRGAWDGPISPLWSLSLEEQFYLLWPLVALAAARVSLARVTAVALGLALAGPLFRLGFLGLFGPSPFALLLPFGYTDQLVWGGVLASITRFDPRPALLAWLYRAALFVALPWLAVALVASPPTELSARWLISWALRPTAVALVALVLVDRARQGITGPIGALLASRPAVHIGKISYGIYLTHPYVHFAAFGLCALPGLRWTRPAFEWLRADGWRWFPVATATAVLVASASWALFERPINDWKRRFRYPSRQTDGAGS